MASQRNVIEDVEDCNVENEVIMDEVMAEMAIGGLVVQHRLRTIKGLVEGNRGCRGGWVFVVRTPRDVFVLNRTEMRRLADWCQTRLAVGIVEEAIRRYQGWL